MSNGTLGEARARAFLLDRFWVLERSVDVQGADLIIQRRLTGKNLLDREAPRLGVVQVKFFGSPATSHFVHKEYVVDDTGVPRDEFFLFCHTGTEEDPRLYIVSGRDLHETFPLTARDGHDGYAISYSRLTTAGRFEVTAPKYSLDRIERQLELAEFVKNRRFLAWALPSVDHDSAAIDPLYREPIDNWWGDIPEGFQKIKRTARTAMLNVEEVYTLLGQVAEATDPLAAEEVLDEIRYHCRDGYGRWSISLPDRLHDGDLFQVCRRHKKIVDQLRADGLLDRYLRMKDSLRAEVVAHLAPRWPVSVNSVHRLSMSYDPATLVVARIESRFAEIDDPDGVPEADQKSPFDLEKLEHSEPGRVVYRWMPGRYGSWKDDTSSPTDFLHSTEFRIYYECLDAVFTMKYGEAIG
jgi:hypothetical protein